MIVVTDASPLNDLVQLGDEDLLRALYHEVSARDGDERMSASAGSRATSNLGMSSHQDGLRHPDPGERAAIEVAKETGAGLVLMDERKRRLVAAEFLGLRLVGVMGILAEACIRRLIDFEPIIEQLRSTTNFRVSQTVLDRAREMIKERQSASD